MPETDFSAINRYHDKNKYGGINKEGIALTKKFVSGKLKEGEKLPRWAERFKEHFTVSGDKLMLDGKEVIAKEDRDKVMRELVYKKDSDVGLARDAGYYQIQKRYWNITRRKWQLFLKAQESLRKTDNLPPRQKAGGQKLKRKGEIEVDIFVITHKDLKDHKYLRKKGSQNLEDGGKKLDYKILNAVDRLTSYCKTFIVARADSATVKNAVDKSLNFFQDLLELKRDEMFVYSDAGAEFASWTWDTLKVDHDFVSVGNKVEQKNSHLQRIFHRLKNSERMTSVSDGLKQAEKIANESYNRILKMSPAEAVKKYNGPAGERLMELYNNARKKGDEDRRGKLEVGMRVRKVTRKTKSAADYTFVKAYHGKTFTDDTYEVKKVVKRGNNYLYQLKDGTNKFYRRDRISENTPAADIESRNRVRANRKKRAPTPPPSPKGVKTRANKKKESEGKDDEKLEEKQSEVPSTKPKKKPDPKKDDKPKKKAQPEPDNVIEEHSKAVLKTAPHFKSRERMYQVLKWVSHQTPSKGPIKKKHKKHDEDPELSEWWYVSKADSDYIDKYLFQVNDFLKHLEKKKNHVKAWEVWVGRRRDEYEGADYDLDQMRNAEYYKQKANWRYSKKMNMQGYKVGDQPKPVPYAKGSKYAI